MFSKIFTLIFIVVLVMSLVGAELNIGYDDIQSTPKVVIEVPVTPINYSLVNVNNSKFWQGYEPSTLPMSVLNDDNTYVRVSGDTMTGNLINNANITAEYFFGNGSQLTDIEGDDLGNHNATQTLFMNGKNISFNEYEDDVRIRAYNTSNRQYLTFGSYKNLANYPAEVQWIFSNVYGLIWDMAWTSGSSVGYNPYIRLLVSLAYGDEQRMIFGDGSDVQMMFKDKDPDYFQIAVKVGSTSQSGNVVITEGQVQINRDHNVSIEDHPTLIIASNYNPAADTRWLWMQHNTTAGRIASKWGDLYLETPDDSVVMVKNLTVTGTFTDLTPFPTKDKKDVLEEVLKIKSNPDGSLNHSSLSDFVKVRVPNYKEVYVRTECKEEEQTLDVCDHTTNCFYNKEEKLVRNLCTPIYEKVLDGYHYERNVPAQVSELVLAIQQQQEDINTLKSELCIVGKGGYSWC